MYTALTPIRDNIALLKDSLLASTGDQLAKDVKVAVYSTGVAAVNCHGCLMRRDNDIYLVSAAHAIVDLTCGDGTYSIQWSVHQREHLFSEATFDKIFVPEE